MSLEEWRESSGDVGRVAGWSAILSGTALGAGILLMLLAIGGRL